MALPWLIAIGILVSAAVTVWVGFNIAKKLSVSRFEKDYLITDLNKMEAAVSEMEKLYKNSAFEICPTSVQ